MFCSAVPQGTHKNPKIVCGLRTHPWSVQSLERHGSSGMPGAVRIRNAGFCDQNRCLQVPPGTCCHFTINSCPCFSPPHPRDAPGFLCTPDILHRPPQEPRQFLDRYRFGILVALQIQCIHLLALILVFFVLHTLKQNLIM